LQQIMDGGAMGVQITVSGKLRGDRSAFGKHTAGILPRSGHHAETIVEEDIAHVQTPMGLIGIRIRIALKERVIPEFEIKDDSVKAKPIKTEEKPKIVDSTETEEKPKIVVSTETEEKPKIVVSTETEQIKLDEEKIKKIESLEEEEEELK